MCAEYEARPCALATEDPTNTRGAAVVQDIHWYLTRFQGRQKPTEQVNITSLREPSRDQAQRNLPYLQRSNLEHMHNICKVWGGAI